ncbi:MAG: nucleoside triphosphate pyrophosphohydrolase [Chloroflexi bacterium]|nr:nucleoside triphosphate pyrophosphohydrolase [Chloroflexota bacterium]
MLTKEYSNSFNEFRNLIAKLRSPEGCPWDRKQTHESLRTTLLEEAYEVLQAIDSKSTDKLREELGDLLLQIVLNAQIAEEAGEFDMDDVTRGIHQKIVHRHPHVFGTAKAKDADEVMQRWEELKAKERGGEQSVMSSVPRQLPALAYAYSLQRRAAGVGFDWDEDAGVLDKVCEEVRELKDAEGLERKSEEFGDLLFTLVNMGRRMGLDLETALRGSSDRFRERFEYMEKLARERGKALDKLTLAEQDALWNEAKEKLTRKP